MNYERRIGVRHDLSMESFLSWEIGAQVIKVSKVEKRHVRGKESLVRAPATKAWTLLRGWEDRQGPKWCTQWSVSSVLHVFTGQQPMGSLLGCALRGDESTPRALRA